MGELQKWSLGLLFSEVKSTPQETRFRYPSRLEAATMFGLVALVLGGMAFWRHADPAPVIWVFEAGAGLVVLLQTWMGLRALWGQRVLIVHRTDRELIYLRRTPLKTDRRVLRFSDLDKLLLLEPRPGHTPDPEQKYDLLLRTKTGAEFYLGTDVKVSGNALGLRLAQLLEIPLESG